MKNQLALKINRALGVDIYDENCADLKLVKRSKKEIKKLFIDDLIGSDGMPTARLRRLTLEIKGA